MDKVLLEISKKNIKKTKTKLDKELNLSGSLAQLHKNKKQSQSLEYKSDRSYFSSVTSSNLTKTVLPTDTDSDSKKNQLSNLQEVDNFFISGFRRFFKIKSLILGFCIAFMSTCLLSILFLVFYLNAFNPVKSIIQADKTSNSKFVKSNNAIKIPAGLSKDDQEVIKSRNLFNKEGTLGDDDKNKKNKISNAGDGSIVKSNLPYRLVGTVYGSNPYNGIATIEDKLTKNKDSFVVGARIGPKITLSQIHQKKVILDNKGRLEYIEIDKKIINTRKRSERSILSQLGSVNRSIPKNSKGRMSQFKEEGYEFKDNKIFMTESYKKKLLTQDFSKVLQDAKADPYMVGGKLAGFKLSRVRQDSIYEKSGFANGDIVTEINGIELTSVSQAISVLQAARNSTRLEVTVIQNGTPNTIEINIGG